MNETTEKIYGFGRFRVNGSEKTLFENGEIVHLPPKVFDTLLLLVENSGRTIGKEEILQTVWAENFVEDNNLQQHISLLRKTLGDAQIIQTIPKRGYRFTATVQILPAPNLSAQNTMHSQIDVQKERSVSAEQAFVELSTDEKPITQYARSGDVNIAYQVIGKGDLDIIFVMGWVSHIEYFWEEPHFAAFLKRIASFSRLILFDKRGTGLSDRVPLSELPTLEQRMDDVRAVMDAVGSKRAVLIGVSEGGPMCSLFAATYPEKTTALVMIGTYAKRIREEDYPWGVSKEDREKFFELMQNDWGKAVGIEARAPSLAADENFRNWWATYLRMGASPGAAVALTKMNAEIDVRNVLPSIRVPSLVIHRRGDLCLKVEEGRYVASLIPACKYVELGGVDHLPFVGEQNEILDEIEEFLTGVRQATDYTRVLATVMSLQSLSPAHMNEKNWREFLKNSRIYIRRQLELFKGTEVSFEENHILAAFSGPAKAIRCACAITEAAERLGISVKTGLHTGECDVLADKYSGVAIELARKIMSIADSEEILVSRTVKDLVAGSGIVFQAHSVESFAGVNGQWRLFTVKR